jgi:hypothetical protein
MIPPRVICLHSEAFYGLLNEVISHIDQKLTTPEVSRWIDSTEAMKLLNITSKTTLQKIRDTGKIRFSQRDRKNILYDRLSIREFIESHAKEKF